jgi:hypothetical protein
VPPGVLARSGALVLKDLEVAAAAEAASSEQVRRYILCKVQYAACVRRHLFSDARFWPSRASITFVIARGAARCVLATAAGRLRTTRRQGTKPGQRCERAVHTHHEAAAASVALDEHVARGRLVCLANAQRLISQLALQAQRLQVDKKPEECQRRNCDAQDGEQSTPAHHASLEACKLGLEALQRLRLPARGARQNIGVRALLQKRTQVCVRVGCSVDEAW